MELNLDAGKYVVAVSGGVDSVVLLDLLFSQVENPKGNLIVAHFDHGIRKDSTEDRKFVEKLAEKYGLKFFYEEGRLGAEASEALARDRRYEFLNRVKDQTVSSAIITAHHKDDLLETIIINVLRGTGRKGLSSLNNRRELARPLLGFTKAEILDYAKKHNLKWREDPSNLDQRYLRNFVRHSIIKKMSEEQKKKLVDISKETKVQNEEIDKLITNLLVKNNEVSRQWFVNLNHRVASEIIAEWLRKEDLRLDKKTIERLVITLKTAAEGKRVQASKNSYFVIEKGFIRMNKVQSV